MNHDHDRPVGQGGHAVVHGVTGTPGVDDHTDRRRRGRLPLVLAVFGALLLAAAAAALVASVRSLQTQVDELEARPRATSAAPQDYRLRAGQAYALWIRNGQDDEDDCVTEGDRDGSRNPGVSESLSWPGTSWEYEGTYTPSSDETVSVVCTGAQEATVAPADILSGTFAVVMMVMGSVVAGGAGITLLIVALCRRVGRRTRRPEPAGQSPAPGMPTGIGNPSTTASRGAPPPFTPTRPADAEAPPADDPTRPVAAPGVPSGTEDSSTTAPDGPLPLPADPTRPYFPEN